MKTIGPRFALKGTIGIASIPQKGVWKHLNSPSQQRGFSLVELLVVIAIILILAAIAIPNLLRSRMAANGASAAASLRQISTANAIYSTVYSVGYAGTLAQLGPVGGGCVSVGSNCADLIDAAISGVSPATPTPIKSGYIFTYYSPAVAPTPTSPNSSFALVGAPTAFNSTGTTSFCMDHSRDLREDPNGAITTAVAAGCVGWP